jgi:formylglycine-generating enzyme required for sulfatase activity
MGQAVIVKPLAPAKPAERRITAFSRRFGEAHLDFACHAAVPVALTPELAYQLWATFRVDCRGALIGAPWIAVADLLLSELCSEVGPDLYEMRPEARKALIARLRGDARLGEARLREVATFLLAAAESGIRTRDPFASSLATSQRWAALAYTEPSRAAAMIAEAMSELSALDPMAWARMEALLSDLDDALSGHAPLRSLASAMAELGRGKTGALERHLSDHGQTVFVAGREVAVPREALNAIAPPAEIADREEAAQEAEPAQREEVDAEPAPIEEPRSRRLNVLVVGTGAGAIPVGVLAAAEGLGAALARAGHTLITGGWPGVDEIAGRAFAGALPADADHESRLLQVTERGQRPAFRGGAWLEMPGRRDSYDDVERAQVVAAIGGMGGTLQRLQLADRMGKHVVPLRWTGGDARSFEPAPRPPNELPLCHTRRVRRMLDAWGLRDLNVERLTARAMAVIDLAVPAKAEAFRRYSDLLADYIRALDPAASMTEHAGLRDYWSELVEAGAGGQLASPFAELIEAGTGGEHGSPFGALALKMLDAAAAPFPEWILFDLARIADLKDWGRQSGARAALAGLAAKHARAQIAEIASGAWNGSAPAGMTGDLREMLLAVRAALGSDVAYFEWGGSIIKAWVPVLLAGTLEMSDRGNDMVEVLREVAPPYPPGASVPLLSPLLASKDRKERMAGYLWICAFAAVPARGEPFEAAFEREITDADERGTPWALLWLMRALVAGHDSMHSQDVSARDETVARVEETLRKLGRYWQENPEKDPRGQGLALIRDRLEGGGSASEEPGGAEQRLISGRLVGGRNRSGPRSSAMEPMSWAVEQGDDRFGAFASFAVGGVVQRMRWVPPGRFVMGSPMSEPGRFTDEGPQHEVELRDGFWMADTPCTQDLWQAVMGDNPSRFRSPERPVELVSWHNCQAFIAKLNALVPGLDARLPTEAEWEYACRAGTTQATWVGDLDIRGDRNAPILDAIAWYGGNSGRGYELREGENSHNLRQKQYPDRWAGTRVVRGKAPNPLGLFDMLGNVYEWCGDWQAPYTASPAIDPAGPAEGASRVIRGGSWHSIARSVRASYRDALVPEQLDRDLGFRIASGAPGPRRSRPP